MSQLRKCSPDDCPEDNIHANNIIQCYSCNSKSHLPCYDIIQPANRVFFKQNIVFICDECLTDKSPVRKQIKGLIQSILTPNVLSVSNTPARPSAADKSKKAKDEAVAKSLSALTSQIVKNT